MIVAFLIAALVLFLASGVGASGGRINLVSVGLACCVAAMPSGRF